MVESAGECSSAKSAINDLDLTNSSSLVTQRLLILLRLFPASPITNENSDKGKDTTTKKTAPEIALPSLPSCR